ncbi:threonine synthase [Ammonifex degensii KC4]|uniref:Threonine synthase n=1 Tax=Ammonifex degensii (strain DSM 10501 / KC4) TaxID=429009 RepID=C9RBT9_AMMDK|nr:threonine synthase [Ammonifex degensii]ACX51716.1 threonine synthase [Ammonifex degensii KC4]
MLYESTRGQAPPVKAAETILQGLAPDGGLYVPEFFPRLRFSSIEELSRHSYPEQAVRLISLFLTDFSPAEVSSAVLAAYNPLKFDTEEIVPLKVLAPDVGILELWHGPTHAFKDLALTLLPHLMTRATQKLGLEKEIVILVATSGDTGKAALESFRDVPKTRIIVFFPSEGVSEIQKRQMITQEGENTFVVAVEGNFDDAQSGVKQLFGDPELRRKMESAGMTFSSANSINWGRLLPQVVYYFSAYARLLRDKLIRHGEEINFVVPTGNFGNILAGFLAREMGLPVRRLILAANANNVLTDFINTGIYDRRRPFHRTISPSMDILISSNLERLLYLVTDRNAEKVRQWMTSLARTGVYQIDQATHERIKQVFWSSWASDDETLAAIKDAYTRYGYLLDPHTGVAWHVFNRYREETGDSTKTVILSTASPFKFARDVIRALAPEKLAGKEELSLLYLLAELTGWPIPRGLQGLESKPIRHTRKATREKMRGVVEEILGLTP